MAAAPELPNHLLDRIADLPDQQRPYLFKGRAREALREWTVRAQQSLRGGFPHPVRFATDEVNIRGADLRERVSCQDIELKTGKVTDANIGLSTMSWALEDSSDRLREIMAGSMRLRQDLALAGKQAEVRRSKEATMQALLAFYRSLGLVEGRPPPPTLEHFARCVARGVTRKKAASALCETPESHWRVPMILHADWSRGWKRVADPFSPEPFAVRELSMRSGGSGNRQARAILRIHQPDRHRTALFYPNYKNSYTIKGVRIPAKHWVKTPCFHVWIDR